VISNREILKTTAFPRSGSTFLNASLKALYYPEETNINFHTVNVVDKYKKIIIPFRDPLDSISSWNIFPFKEEHNIEIDIKYYLRFFTNVMEKRDKVVFFDFSKFTVDLEYTKNKIYKNFNIQPVYSSTIKDIKASMLENKKDLYLPRDNSKELDKVKEILIKMPEFQACQDLHLALQKLD
jgi:hypothetical protein